MVFNGLFANRSWFDFRIDFDGPGFDSLGVYEFSGEERVNGPYAFTVELVSTNSNLDIDHALGKECLLTIRDKSGGKRLVHGVVRQMEQLHTANAFTHYRCAMAPYLWFLTQRRDCRIYQRQTVPEIIHAILHKNRFLGNSFDFNLRETYPKREYCVQYNETDYHFLCRIAEEEGISFYHEHQEDRHCLWFTDAEGGPPIPGESDLRFFPGSGQVADTAVISRLDLKNRINSDSSTFREWNFTTPAVDLTGRDEEPDWEKAPTPQAMELETYRFPHLYQIRDEGERYAKLQLMRQLTLRKWVECATDIARHTPGHTFTLHSHPRDEANRGWWITRVRHQGKQPGVLEHESPDGRGLEYQATVTAIPDTTRFVPEQKHTKVRIEGLQSAIVTGPGGEEVYCDRYGRVKVQFHWDRLGKHDAGSSCWVRVADSWAGVNFGFIQIPRIGQEVMVEFMEGDPDRPVITGRVYNTDKMPPWELPGQKTLSGIQSREFKGIQRNQLLLDDTQGEVQAQLSSDHGLSQLNLGRITRVHHVQGRDDFRGEGFELRTDSWGAIRAAMGMYITTNPRSNAEQHHKDMSESIRDLAQAVKLHKKTAELAEVCKSREYRDGVKGIVENLERQHSQIKGDGARHSELEAAHIVIASPAGVAVTTPESTHMHTGEDMAITTEGQTTVSSNKSFLVSAMEMVGIFAYRLGMRLMAAKGKVEIEAQSDEMDIIADKDMKVFSANGRLHVSSPKEILLTAGGSYIRISENGIEQGTDGEWKLYSASQSIQGPNTRPWLNRAWKDGTPPHNARVVVRDELGKVLDVDRYATEGSQNIDAASAAHALHLVNNPMAEECLVRMESVKGLQHVVSFGTTVNLTASRAKDAGAE